MKKITKRIFSFIMVFGMILSLVPAATMAADSPRVFILGDSTAETKKGDAEHLTGWGEVLHNFFDDPYMIKNYAVSGESSKHFYNGYWLTSIKGQVKKGDYVIIQFGHNDIKAPSVQGDMGETTTNWSYYTYPSDNLTDTDSNGCYSFGYYLNKYVTEVREAGGIPIFVTSIERRKDAYISADPAVSPHSQLAGYMAAMNSIASKLTVPVIDVYTQTRTEIVKNPIGTLNPWYMSYHGGEDDTHLTEAGAMAVAKMVAEGIKASQDTNVKGLAAYLKASFDGITNVAPPFYIDTDFEGGSDGNTVSGYDNWFFTDSSPDKDIKYKKETLQDGSTNIYANFTATAEYVNNDRKLATLERNFSALNNQYVHFSYKLRSNSANNGSFISILNGSSGYTEYHTVLSTSKVSGVNFKDYDGNAMSTGQWYQYDYYINTATGDLTLKVNGRNILKHVVNEKLIGLNQIRLGFTRTTPVVDNTAEGVDAAVAIDDIKLYTIDESEFNEATGVFPSNVILKETFEDGNNGEALSSTLSPGWVYTPATDNGGASYKATYWKESGATPANLAMLFTNSDATKQGLTYTTNNITDITSGYVHIGWRMQAVSQTQGVTCYFNPSGYNGQLGIGTADFVTGNWYNFNAYINLSTNEFTLYRGKVALKEKVVIPISNKLTSVSFSMYRKDANYQIAFDDFIVETISQADYKDAIGELPDGWKVITSATIAESSSSIKVAADPSNEKNSVIEFNRGVQNLRAEHFFNYSFTDAIEDGCHSLKFKIAPSDDDTKIFWLRITGTSTSNTNSGAKTYATINFNFIDNTITIPGVRYVTNGSVKSDATIQYEFKNDQWCNVELVFDLTARDNKPAKVSLYLDNEEKLTDLYFSNIGFSSFNDGTIKSILFGFDTGTGASILAEPTADNPVCARVLLDDVVIEELKNETVGLVKSGDTLSGIKINAGWKPASEHKFLVAVYNTEDGMITALKSAEIVTVSARGDNQTVSLTNPVNIEATDIVKAFFWNMNTLEPISSQFAETIN